MIKCLLAGLNPVVRRSVYISYLPMLEGKQDIVGTTDSGLDCEGNFCLF